MNVNLKGHVYSVGDGFCYEGIIINKSSEYHFVIDCGSQPPRKNKKRTGELTNKEECDNRLKEIADTISKNGNDIDLFLLTHFHQDHFNGYPHLFEKTKIHTIIMPYLYPEERLYLMLNHSMKKEDIILFANLYKNILEEARKNCPDTKLILVRGYVDDKESLNQQNNINISWGKQHEDSENIFTIENLESEKQHVEVVRVFPDGTQISDFSWKFKLFNLEVEKEKLEKFREAVGKDTIKAEDLLDFFQENKGKSRTQLKKKYEVIALDKDINNTSIVVCHIPTEMEEYDKDGTLITGDINLNHGIANQILDYFKEEKNKIGLFSIPHHGSNKNWNTEFIKSGYFDRAVCFLSSYNYYSNRLTPEMMSDLRMHNIFVLIVDENKTSEFNQYFKVYTENSKNILGCFGCLGGIRYKRMLKTQLETIIV